MNDHLITILWRQWPAGWHIRALDTNGHYTAELLSQHPPYRHLTSGCLFPWDKRLVIELGQHILSLTDKTSLPVQPTSYTGFISLKAPTLTEGLSFYYTPATADHPQAKTFLEMVAVLDPYFAYLNVMLRLRSELYVGS